MAKRRSKIKIGAKASFRACSGKGQAKSSSTARKLCPDLDLNSLKSSDGTCTEDSLQQEKVQVDYVIDTKTATAESSEEHLITSEQSSEKEKCLETKMKKSTSFRGKVSTNDKTLGTIPREIDGETCLDVECGENSAVMHLSKLCVGSKGACIDFEGSWLTPNEFQFVSGRETAKDWKRSIRHNGFSLKLLIVNGHIELNASPPPSSAPATPTSPSHAPETSSSTTSVVQNKRETKTSDSVAKNDETSAEEPDNKRLYIPVKRRNGVKVGGRRRKVKSRKRVEPRRPPKRQVTESPKPDVQDSDKDSIETTPRPSEILEPDVANTKETETDEKESEEFFKLLKLSKTNGKNATPSPVNTPTTHEAEMKLDVEVDINENTKLESTEKASSDVIETFRSRLIPDETGLRIAINRQVVCMKGKETETKMIEETASVGELADETVESKPDDAQVADSGEKHTENNNTCKEDINVTVKAEPLDDSITVKADVQSKKESDAVWKNEIKDTENIENECDESMPCLKAIEPQSFKENSTSSQKVETDTESECSKCVDIVKESAYGDLKSTKSRIDKMEYSLTHVGDLSNDIDTPPPLLYCNPKQNDVVKCECREIGCSDGSHKNMIRPSKPTTSDSALLHGKVPEPRSNVSTPVKDPTFQDKAKYENDMLDLMSMYRPVMMPCDGICPYVCPDPSTALRSYGDSPIPYTSCNNPKWPQSFPLLSGVMTPEMMLYMTQQLYYDMYNNSLYAQCASSDKVSRASSDRVSSNDRVSRVCTEKVSQSKPIKRKEPEHDPDTPLDLTVKRAKFDKISTKQCATNISDAPLDFSKKSSHTMDKKTSGVTTHTHSHANSNTHSHSQQHKLFNGHVKPHGYNHNGVHRSPSQQSSAPTCTCGRRDDLRTWNVDKVCSFLKQYNGCAAYTKTFREQGIDGRLLPYLTMQHLTRTLGMQTRPALTFLDAVDQQLKAGTNTRRFCETCKA